MHINSNQAVTFSLHRHRSQALLVSIVVAFAAYMASLPPLPHRVGYHDLADKRSLFGPPNLRDLVLNIPFLIVALTSVVVCPVRLIRKSRAAWGSLFVDMALVSFGLACCHWRRRTNLCSGSGCP